MLVRVERHPTGPRLFIGSWRSEHWKAGLALIGWGGWWVYKDRADFKAWAASRQTRITRRTATAGTSPPEIVGVSTSDGGGVR